MSSMRAPGMLDGAGLRLWRKLTASVEFDGPHAIQVLTELCRTVSLCEVLEGQLRVEGPIVDGQRGPKVNPIMAELRQQRITAARLTAALAIPTPPDDDPADDKPAPRGGARGVYTPQVARS